MNQDENLSAGAAPIPALVLLLGFLELLDLWPEPGGVRAHRRAADPRDHRAVVDERRTGSVSGRAGAARVGRSGDRVSRAPTRRSHRIAETRFGRSYLIQSQE